MNKKHRPIYYFYEDKINELTNLLSNIGFILTSSGLMYYEYKYNDYIFDIEVHGEDGVDVLKFRLSTRKQKIGRILMNTLEEEYRINDLIIYMKEKFRKELRKYKIDKLTPNVCR